MADPSHPEAPADAPSSTSVADETPGAVTPAPDGAPPEGDGHPAPDRPDPLALETSPEDGHPEGEEDAPRKTRRLAVGAVVLAPIVANLVAILNIVKYQPQARTSAIGFVTKVGFLSGGQPFVDPNVGYNSYAVGHAAALSWLHGHVPWWNFNEGIGAPLAASIQSASFFPLTLLLAATNGALWFHVGLELIAGVATYALLRELRCSPFAAAVGAIAFALNGSLAWITNAPANVVPFIPVCILGVEWIVNGVGAKRRGGWITLAIGVWLLIVAGFPEVAVFGAGLTALWLVVRLVQRRHDALRISGRTALGVVVGLLLAAPLLNAFVRALRTSNVGLHSHMVARLSVPAPGLSMLVAPYVYGGIFDNTNITINTVWSRIGGYTGVALLVLAVGALFGSRERLLRLALAGFALLFLGSSYDVVVLHQIVENLPGLLHIDVDRYSTAAAIFAMCVLAALCLDDLRSLRPLQILVRMAPGAGLAILAFLLGFYASPAGRVWARHNLPKWYWGSIVIFAGSVLVVTIGVFLVAMLAGRRGGTLVRWLLGGLVLVEAFGFFEVPILAYPRAVHYDTAAVAYLRAHLGTERFYTVSAISPNWGTYYGISEFDLADLPIPKNWGVYVHRRLNPCEYPWQFGNGPPIPGCPLLPAREMLALAPNYEASGVKYFVTGSAVRLGDYFQPRTGPGPATPNGAATMVLEFAPPAFFPTSVATGFYLRLSGAVPPGLVTTACTPTACVSATPGSSTPLGVRFTFARPVKLLTSLKVTLEASNSAPIVILTAPGKPGYPSSVVADGTLLPDRTAILSFIYVPSTIPRLAVRTTAASIYLLPHTTPVATAPACSVKIKGITDFVVNCRRPSALTYRELADRGWSATVRGKPAQIRTVEGVFQRVLVPKGTSVVRFTYDPPDALFAWLAALLGVLAILVGLATRRAGWRGLFAPRDGVLVATTRGTVPPDGAPSLLGTAVPPGPPDPRPPSSPRHAAPSSTGTTAGNEEVPSPPAPGPTTPPTSGGSAPPTPGDA